MGHVDEVWLIAGGEPGAERFGQLVQRLRKEKGLAVEELAAASELSVGTIRAVEQARRAPSRESGLRLLRELLPDGALSLETDVHLDADPRSGHISSDIVLVEPESGTRVLLEFRAKTAGDNRRWSSDKPRAGESETEALIRRIMSEAGLRRDVMAKALAALGEGIVHAAAVARAPASDSAVGRVVRQLAVADAITVERVDNLLWLWAYVGSDTADADARDVADQINALLLRHQRFSDGDEIASAP